MYLNLSKFNVNRSSLFTVLYVVTILILQYYVIYNYLINFDRYLMSLLVLLVYVYIFVNLWFYFSAIYHYSNYTSAIQRFWKRTFMLFWIIEGFLFSIFVFLYFNCSEVAPFFMDINSRKQSTQYLEYNNFIYHYSALVSISFLILYLKKFNINVLSVMYLVLICILCVVLYVEFFKFIQTLNVLYNSKNFVFRHNSIVQTNLESSLLNIEYSSVTDTISEGLVKKRTTYHYSMLVNILKFWHVVLVIVLTYLQINSLFFKKISYDIMSSMHLNIIYIYLFNLIYILLLFKPFFNINLVYFWFFENINVFIVPTLFEIYYILV